MRRMTIESLTSELSIARQYRDTALAFKSALENEAVVSVKLYDSANSEESIGSAQGRLWSDCLLAALESVTRTAREYVRDLDAHGIKHDIKLPDVRALRRKYGRKP